MNNEKTNTIITYYGHSCFMVEFCDTKLLFDPYITPNDKAAHIDISIIKPDYILVTHAHGDHMADVEHIAKQSDATVVSNFEIVNWFQNRGVKNAHPLNHGGSLYLDNGVYIKYVNAIHTSSFPDGSYGGQPGGFLIGNRSDNRGGHFYYSGDTALTYDMKLIAEMAQVSFAFLCIGDNFTMGIDDAIKAANFIGTHQIIGMHFDTFPPIEINHEEAIRKFSDAGYTLKLPRIGEKFALKFVRSTLK